VAVVKWQDHALRVETSAPAEPIGGRAFPIKISHERPGSAAIAISAEGKTSGSTFSLNSIEGSVGEDKFDGWASVRFSRIPSVTADVHFHRLTIPPLWPTGGETAVSAPWSDDAIDLDALNFVDANAKISATELVFDRFRAGPIATETVVERSVLTAILDAQVNDGRASGRLSVDAAQPVPQWQLQLDLADVRAGPIVSSFTGANLVEGLMRTKMELSGNGNSARRIMSSLGGNIELALQDGEIPGINIADMVRTLAAQTIKGWRNDGVQKTDFTALNVTFRVESGRAETESIRLLGPFVRVTGKGTVDLAQKTMDLKFEPKVVLSMQGQGATGDPVGLGVPVAVEGPWQEPRIYPDIAGIFDNPDDAFARLNALSGGIFGGKDGKSGGGLFDSLGQGFDRLLGGNSDGKQGTGASKPSNEGGKEPSETSRPPSDIIKQLFGR
jgi:AsmA protein